MPVKFYYNNGQVEKIPLFDGEIVFDGEDMTREKILDKAKDIVTGHREHQYGKPEDNFQLIADLWSDYLDIDFCITTVDVAMMMALLKIARIKTGTQTKDSFIDLAGYAACGGELA